MGSKLNARSGLFFATDCPGELKITPCKCTIVFKRFFILFLLSLGAVRGVFAQNLPRVVMLPLENRLGAGHEYDVGTLTEMLAAFINQTRRLNVIDRFTLDTAMAARGWQARDWEDLNKTAEMGRALNAQYIVRGMVLPLGDYLLVSVRILDIGNSDIKGFTNMQLEAMSEANSKMNSLAQLLTYTLEIPVQPEPMLVTAQPGTADADRSARLNTLGVSVGTTFAAPLYVATVQGTFALWKYSFFELGMDAGFGIIQKDVDFFSLYPYVRYALFVPFANGGWYIGAGGGFMIATYTFPVEGKTTGYFPAADVSTGFIFGSGITIFYSVRTDFTTVANSKLGVGYSYRFK